MPRMTLETLDEFLAQPTVGVIATLRQDGAPYTVPVWWLWLPDEDGPRLEGPALDDGPRGFVWITGTYSRIWCRQLLHDQRASLCIESGPPLTAHVEFDGLCDPFERPSFDIWPISRMLAEKYVGRGLPENAEAVDRFFANMQTEPRLLFRLSPRVTRAIDMRVYQGKRGDREFQSAQRAED